MGKARALIHTLLAEGKSPASLHLILGVDAWQSGRAAEALAHWEQSYQLSPHMAVVANNLAWALAHPQPLDLRGAIATFSAIGPLPAQTAVAAGLGGPLLRTPGPDLPRALGIADSVVKRFPTNVRFRDTRGHILLKMGRWQEAVADLVVALPEVPNKRETHRALAEGHRQLGMNALAAEHQRLAEAKEP